VDIVTALTILLALITVAVFEIRSLKWATYAYAVQTITLVAIFVAIAAHHNVKILFVWAITAFITKVIFVPYILIRLLKKIPFRTEELPIGGALSPFIAISIAISIAVFLSDIYMKFSLIKLPIPLTVSIFVFMMGILGLTFRKSAFKQILMYCLFENGAHLTLALTAYNAPETVEIGILTDAIFAVIVMAVLAERFSKYMQSLDTSKANLLKG